MCALFDSDIYSKPRRQSLLEPYPDAQADYGRQRTMRYRRSDEDCKRREWRRRTLLGKCGGQKDIWEIDDGE